MVFTSTLKHPNVAHFSGLYRPVEFGMKLQRLVERRNYYDK